MSQIHGQNPSKDTVEVQVDSKGRLLTSTVNDTSAVLTPSTGTISTQNVGAPNGNAVTANSTVSFATNGTCDTASIQVTGTYTGVLSVQVQIDGSNWVTLTGNSSLTNAASGAQSATIASAAVGMWQLDVSAFTGVRVTALAAVTGSATVTILASSGSGIIGIDTPLTIGSGTVSVSGYPTAAAAADALSNPTITQVGADAMNYNNLTWDRVRNNYILTLDTSAARTASGTGTIATNHNARGARFVVNVTAVSGTTPTMTVRLQYSYDGANFIDYDTTNLQTAPITANGQYVFDVYPGLATTANASRNGILPRTFRLVWTIGGTTPSFTFATYAHLLV